MHRDGVEDEFRSSGVPREVEQAWFDELLEEQIVGLTRPGNWRSLSFLSHHGRSEYLDQVVGAKPLGEWWERCSFLEGMLTYVEYTCRRFYPPGRLAEVCRSVAEQAAPLADTMPADQPPNRVRDLVARAESLAAMLSPPAGGSPGGAGERGADAPDP